MYLEYRDKEVVFYKNIIRIYKECDDSINNTKEYHITIIIRDSFDLKIPCATKEIQEVFYKELLQAIRHDIVCNICELK